MLERRRTQEDQFLLDLSLGDILIYFSHRLGMFRCLEPSPFIHSFRNGRLFVKFSTETVVEVIGHLSLSFFLPLCRISRSPIIFYCSPMFYILFSSHIQREETFCHFHLIKHWWWWWWWWWWEGWGSHQLDIFFNSAVYFNTIYVWTYFVSHFIYFSHIIFLSFIWNNFLLLQIL